MYGTFFVRDCIQMSLVSTIRCQAFTKRDGEDRQCKHTTSRGIYCWQHEKQLKGFRITSTNTNTRPGLGLITEKRIPIGALIAPFGGHVRKEVPSDKDNRAVIQLPRDRVIDTQVTTDKGVGHFAKPPKVPREANAEIVLQGSKPQLYAIKTLEPGTEVLARPRIAEAPPAPRRLRRPRARIPNEIVQKRIAAAADRLDQPAPRRISEPLMRSYEQQAAEHERRERAKAAAKQRARDEQLVVPVGPQLAPDRLRIPKIPKRAVAAVGPARRILMKDAAGRLVNIPR
jgi:hypothetical protein